MALAQSTLASMGAWLRTWNPLLTDEPHVDAGGLHIWWYSTPEFHIVEWAAHNAFFAVVLAVCARWAWRVDVGAAPTPAPSGQVGATQGKDVTPGAGVAARHARVHHTPAWLRVLDYALRVCCFVNAVATASYKLSTGRLVYLLQPCHLTNYVLCFLSVYSGPGADTIFAFVLTFMYGTVLALATPDLRGLDRPGEQVNFFSQHIMLLLLPAVWVAIRRYPIYRGFHVSIAMWAVASFLHWDLMLPASILLDGNVNYMLVPPKVFPKSVFPAFYRPIMNVVCLVFTLVSRYIFVDGVIAATGVRRQYAAELEAAAQDAAGKNASASHVNGGSRGSGWVDGIARPPPVDTGMGAATTQVTPLTLATGSSISATAASNSSSSSSSGGRRRPPSATSDATGPSSQAEGRTPSALDRTGTRRRAPRV